MRPQFIRAGVGLLPSVAGLAMGIEWIFLGLSGNFPGGFFLGWLLIFAFVTFSARILGYARLICGIEFRQGHSIPVSTDVRFCKG